MTGSSRNEASGRPPRKAVRGAVELVGALPMFALAPLFRRWHMRWGATDAEVAAPMQGDELVVPATFLSTRAISIAAPPEAVWPWIVQMGYGRGGFYTYDLIDNGGYPSADRVLDEFQQFEVGDWAFPMNGLFGIELPLNESDAFKVRAFATGRWLVWEKPDSTWSWLLKPIPGGTRLTVRIRAHPANLFWTLFMEFGDPPMAVRMLRGIKKRAEASC
ncbi:MAG TPA: SRPBCC family protein [Thermoleophilia bacterium]|nr:SRPBCC family protein [Thermoleophilia bacterium]